MAKFLGFVAPNLETAIHNYIAAKFGSWDIDDQYIPPDVETVREWAFDLLNQWRGTQRTAVGLTSAEFQELVYTGKAMECQRWIADQESVFGLAGEAAARGISNLEMAQLVIGQHNAWLAASDQIEAAYVGYKATINTAQSIEEIEITLASMK